MKARGGLGFAPGDLVEGEILGGAAGLLTPLIEEAAVTEGKEIPGIDAKFAAGRVNPLRRALKFGVEADGGLVKDAVAGRVRVFGAPLFVDEGGLVAELGEDVADGLAVRNIGFGFFAMFMASGGVVVPWEAFVGDDPAVAVPAHAQDGLARAEAAVGGVEEEVALEGAGGFLVEACRVEPADELGGVGDRKLDLDFHHENRV